MGDPCRIHGREDRISQIIYTHKCLEVQARLPRSACMATRVTCMPQAYHMPTTCHTCETFARALVKFAFVRARLSAAHAQPWLRAPGQGWLAQPSGLGPVSSRLSLRVVGCHDIVLRLWYGGWYESTTAGTTTTLAYKYSWGMGHLQFPTDLHCCR